MNKTALKNNNGFSGVIILIGIVLLIGVGGVAYYFSTNKEGSDNTSSSGGTLVRKESKGNQEIYKVDDETIIVGDDITLPKDFPENVPVYPRSKIISAAYIDGQAHLQQTTNDAAEKVLEWYKKELMDAGWEVVVTSPDGITVENDELFGDVVILPPEIADQDGKSIVSVNTVNKGSFGEGDMDLTEMMQDIKEMDQDLQNEFGIDTDLEWE